MEGLTGRKALGALLVGALLVGGVVAARPASATTIVGLEVTGRVRYEGGDGAMHVVRGAKVQLCDDDRLFGLGNDCELMAEGVTGDDGRFSLVGDGGDIEGYPDVYVRVFAETDAGNVTLETLVAFFEYCMATVPRVDYDPTGGNFDLDVGDLSPDNTVPCNFLGPFADVDQEHAAWQQLDFLGEVHSVAEDLIADPMPKVSIVWPSTLNGVPFYTPVVGQIRMVPGFEDHALTLYHEYGHHVMYAFAESPLPDYDNDVCDESNPLRDLPFFGGHCFWSEEKGSIHWSEGFPNFWAEVVNAVVHPGAGPLSSGVDTDGDDEADEDVTTEHPWLADGSSPSPAGTREEQVEGWTHVVLRDLWDADEDNHDADTDAHDEFESDSADRVQFSFEQLWDVVQTDPDPDDIFHDHPTTLLEFRELLVAAHPDRENRVNAVFTENGIFQFGADLGVRNLTTDAAASQERGSLFLVADETFNDADAAVGTGEGTHTTYMLEPVGAGDPIVLGSPRPIGALDPGEADAGSRIVNVPTAAVPGTYELVACVDAAHEIYESQPPGIDNTQVPNCASGPTITVLNRPPVADGGGPYAFDEGSGGLLDASGSSDPDVDDLDYAWSSDDGILASPLDGETVSLHDGVDDGTYTVSVEVSDPWGGSDTAEVEVVVRNVQPTVDSGADADVDEGDTVSRTVTVDDPVDATFTASVDWGDGAGPVALGPVGASFDVSRVFDDDAAATVEVCVDDGTDVGCDSFAVNASNVAPAFDDDPVTVSGTEGTALSSSAAFSDPGADSWTGDATWGDGDSDSGALAGRAVPLDHTYAQDGSYAGLLCATDDDGGSDCSVLGATIANVAPAVGAVTVVEPVMATVDASASVSFDDPGLLDPHTATIDWGDGAGPVAAAVTSPTALASGLVTGTHTYASEGDVTVTVCVTDDDDTRCRSAALRVRSVAEAAEYVIDALRDRGSSDPAVIAAIGLLDGTPTRANSGALDKMLAEDWVSAVGKLGDAITALDAAATDESATQSVLASIAEAIARQRLLEVEALGLTGSGVLKQVAAVRTDIAAGRTLFLAGSYRAAVDNYKSATRKAVDLLARYG